MQLSRRTLLCSSAATAAISVLPAACSKAPEAATDDNSAKLLQEITDQILAAYPESASSAGIDTGKYLGLKSKLTDRSPAGQAKIESGVRETLARLRKVDTAAMAPDDALNIDVVRTVFETTAEGFDFPYGDVALLNSNWSYRNSPYAVAQNTGAFVEIPTFLDSSHTIETIEDAGAYLARMEAYADQLDGETERTIAAGELGVILPDYLMTKTLGQMYTSRTTPVENWGIVATLATKATSLGGDYADKAKAIAESKIGPAIERQIAALEALAPRATSDAGIWAKPEGEAYYAWALKAGTTTTMSPDEVHQMGRDELESLHARMDPILRSIGYTDGSVGARMTALAEDPRYKFSPGDAGRAEIMDVIETTLTDIRARMPQAFETLVPGFLEVTRIPKDVEAGAPGAYGGAGSIDGKQPGHFWINLRTPDLHSRFSLPDLTYHEAIPGHVWQGEYAFKQPLIRSLLAFNAYSEGWALYAEQIADELGVYDDFPVGRLGYLQSLAFRACRLVVDTGLHAKRWTRAEAIDWFVTNNGSNPEEVQSEVDRYCAWPGQACGYKVGHSAIVRLREKAKAALGDKFDFRQFNDAVVLGGNVPMTVLDRVIDGYIARETAK
ncbi:DUF885 domain-containing protein [Hyphococcus sp.]|uniref:DUF885 domain-containing protein n=1 Tax=Hyphococcus sp. TaxID=2038636 RepID=UPI002082B774|nr:MAG: hypothetical protein DHS20C04_27480 [Marinicaulis sp.]